MNTLPLIALPGTLLDSCSLALMLAGLDSRTLLLGDGDTLDDEVDRLAAAADQPTIWVGHSLGGIVALQLARRHPGRVAGLVLLASNARSGRDTSEERRAAQWTLAQRHGLARLVRDYLAPAYGLFPGDAMVDALAEQAACVGLARFGRQLGYARQRPGLLAPRRPLACPLLAVSGEHDALCPPTDGRELVALVQPPARGEHDVLPQAGHLFSMQQPAMAAQCLRGFLHAFELGAS